MLAGLIGLLTLCEYIFGWNLGIDHWLVSEPAGTVGTSHPGRMAPETALNFVLLSVALGITGGSRKTRWTILTLASLGLLVASLALAAMLSYLTPGLGAYGWFGLTIMAVHTAILFAMLSLAVIAISWRPDVLSWSLSRRTTAAFACGMAVLVFIGFTTSRSQFWMKETNRQIAYSEEVLADIDGIVTEIIDAQAHALGYIITGHEWFKTHDLETKAVSKVKLEALRKLVADNPHQQQQFARIEAQAKAQLQLFQQAIDAERTGLSDAARSQMVVHGEAMLDGLRSTFDQIENEHHQHIQQLKREAESVSLFSYLIIFIGTLASLLIFLSVIFRLNSAMSERKLAEAKIQRLNQLYNLLSQCNQAVVRSVNQEELFQHICRDAVNIGGMKLAWISLVDEVSKRVVPVASYGEGVEYLDGLQISVDADDAFGQDPGGMVIRENRPCWCQDIMHDPLTAPQHELGARFGWAAIASLPLHRNGVAIGAFTFYSDKANAFDEAVRRLLVEMATDISYALDNFAREAKRKAAELQLIEHEMQYRTLADSGQALIWASGTDKLCNYFNQPWLKFTGRTLEQELGNGWTEGVHPDDLAQCLAIYAAAFDRREPFSMAYRLRRHDGEYRWIQDDGCPRYDNEGEFIGYIGYGLDITELKHTEDKLAESERHFRAVTESANDAIITAGAGAGAGYIMDWNAAAERLFGYTKAEIIGQPLTVLMPERFRNLHREGLARVAAGGVPHVIGKTVELVGLHKDGSEFPLELSLAQWQAADGQFFTAIIRDITERKQAEVGLRNSEEKFSKAFRASPDVLIISRRADGLIIEANDGWERLFGYSREESIGSRSLELGLFANPADRQRAVAQLQEQGFVRDFEVAIKRKTGAMRQVILSVEPIEIDNEPCILTIIHDITERKQAEAKLAEQVEELRRWHEATLGREMRTLELKHEVNELLDQAGQPARYPSAEQSNAAAEGSLRSSGEPTGVPLAGE